VQKCVASRSFALCFWRDKLFQHCAKVRCVSQFCTVFLERQTFSTLCKSVLNVRTFALCFLALIVTEAFWSIAVQKCVESSHFFVIYCHHYHHYHSLITLLYRSSPSSLINEFTEESHSFLLNYTSHQWAISHQTVPVQIGRR
jgi:hypothetical protein